MKFAILFKKFEILLKKLECFKKYIFERNKKSHEIRKEI